MLIVKKITLKELVRIVEEGYYGDVRMAKFVVDIRREVLAIGGEWHADAQQVLLNDGSLAEDTWGANLYPWKLPRERIVYNSLINLKPKLPHRSMDIKDRARQEKIKMIVNKFLLNDNETLSTK